jgi:hypothetical protein
VVGHVDLAWCYSFAWPGLGGQTEAYRGALARLGAGHTVGSALEYLRLRAAELAADLEAVREDIRIGKRVDDQQLADVWLAARDASSYVILGDPAVRAVPDPHPAAAGPARQAAERPRTGPVPAAPTPVAVARPIEIDTYLTDDPTAVGVDTDSGRITGAVPYISSRVSPDGAGRHVLTSTSGVLVGGAAAPGELDRRTAVDLHTRLVEIFLTALREGGTPDTGERSDE